MISINLRDKRTVLFFLIILLLSTALIVYFFLNRSTDTRSRASLSNTIDTDGLSEDSTVDTDGATNVSLYKEEGYLYKTQGKGINAALEFIQKNPTYDSHQSEDARESVQPRREESVRGASSDILLPEDSAQDLSLRRSVDDTKDAFYKKSALKVNQKHYFYNQDINDIPVFGSSLAIHIRNENEVYAIDANLANEDITTKSVLSVEQAQQIALSQAQKEATASAELQIIDTKKYIFNFAVLGLSEDAKNYVTQAVTVGADQFNPEPFLTMYFVDVEQGKILHRISRIQDALNRKIRNPSSCTGDAFDNPTSCQIRRNEGSAPINDTDVDNTYDFLGQIYDFYKNNYGRDSYNNAGAEINALPHYPSDCPNAYWNGKAVYFCNGWATNDIVGHELTHAVTEYTAGLIYSHQSGALNEATSDIFGYAIDPSDWLVGEETTYGTLRSFSNPPTYSHPDRLFSSYYYCSDFDSGGVHTNSGVINKTFYLMVAGGNFNGCSITGVGAATAHAIVYRSLTTYLTQSSNFKHMYNAINRSCNDLYGENSSTCAQVKKAAQATELDQQPPGDQTSPICQNVSSAGATCNPNTPSPTPTPTPLPPGSYFRVFITSSTTKGNFGGLTQADNICQTRANTAGIGGTWKAWLSDSTTSASLRLHHATVPYKLVNGTIIANNWTDLTDGSIQNKINIDENGNAKSSTNYVLTGTNTDGSSTRKNCSSWTTTTSIATEGRSNSSSASWTNDGNYNCTYKDFLYCFEQPSSTTPTPTPVPTNTPTPTLTPTPTPSPTSVPSHTFGKALRLYGQTKIETAHDPSFSQDVREKAVRIEAFINPRYDVPTGNSINIGYIVYSKDEYGLQLKRSPDGFYYLTFWIADKSKNCQKSEYTTYMGLLYSWRYIIVQYHNTSSAPKSVDVWLDGYKTTQQVNWGDMCEQKTFPPYDIQREIYIGGSEAENENYKGYLDHVFIGHAKGADGSVPQVPYTPLTGPVFRHGMWHFDNDLTDQDGSRNNGFARGPVEYVDSYPYNPPLPTPSPTPTLLPGDINGDGKVDILDFNIWLCEFLGNGTCANPPSNKKADLNSDGQVDIIDFVIWKNAFKS